MVRKTVKGVINGQIQKSLTPIKRTVKHIYSICVEIVGEEEIQVKREEKKLEKAIKRININIENNNVYIILQTELKNLIENVLKNIGMLILKRIKHVRKFVHV